MKHRRVIFLVFALLSCQKILAQSVLTLGPGTTLGVLAGADLCVNIINGSGSIYGGGTICGTVVGIEREISPNIPSVFALNQNFPNPFNPATTIKYQLPKSAYVRLIIYDQLGREVAELFKGNQAAGFYSVVFDSMNLASGIYLCRINADEFSHTIKMSLLK